MPRLSPLPKFHSNVKGLLTRWRALFAIATYAGLRKGELAGLTWDDIDFGRRQIHVCHSYEGETKTGKDRYVPISAELLPHVVAHAQARTSNLVFPTPAGKMMPPAEKLVMVLKRALKRADIVTGYQFRCRRKACGCQDDRDQAAEAHCPVCNMKLWIKPLPKPLRFHDLRATFATHLRERTGDVVLVQKMLGHSSPTNTAAAYSGVRDDYAQAQIETLTFGTAPPVGNWSERPTRTVQPATPATLQASTSHGKSECAWQESNLRPSASEADALSN